MDTPNPPEATPPVPAEQHSALVDEIGALVSQAGGVSGLAQQFEQKGLGGLISGWISTGPNPPIGGEQVIQLLGREQVLGLASKLGLSEAQVTSGISSILPKIVDELTPQGNVPEHTPSSYENAFSLIKGKLFGA